MKTMILTVMLLTLVSEVVALNYSFISSATILKAMTSTPSKTNSRLLASKGGVQ